MLASIIHAFRCVTACMQGLRHGAAPTALGCIQPGEEPNTQPSRQENKASLGGTARRGEFEDRLKAVIKEVTDSNGKIVLFIDEIHLVVGAGATGLRAGMFEAPFSRQGPRPRALRLSWAAGSHARMQNL